jgi:hypothetical protein
MYIDVRIIENQDKIWRFTGIYGESRWDQKYKTWDKLRELRNNSPLPSIVLGDFNELLFSHEKRGGQSAPSKLHASFPKLFNGLFPGRYWVHGQPFHVEEREDQRKVGQSGSRWKLVDVESWCEAATLRVHSVIS